MPATGAGPRLCNRRCSPICSVMRSSVRRRSTSRWRRESAGGPFYKRIERIALVSIIGLIAAIVLLLILSAPIQEASERAERAGTLQVTLTYYLLVGLAALVAGLFVGVIVMLYNAIQTVITAVAPAAAEDGLG